MGLSLLVADCIKKLTALSKVNQVTIICDVQEEPTSSVKMAAFIFFQNFVLGEPLKLSKNHLQVPKFKIKVLANQKCKAYFEKKKNPQNFEKTYETLILGVPCNCVQLVENLKIFAPPCDSASFWRERKGPSLEPSLRNFNFTAPISVFLSTRSQFY